MLASRVRGLEQSPIRKIVELLSKAAHDRDIISFGGGAPSLAPPPELVDFLEEELRVSPQMTSSYTSTSGLPELRNEIAKDLRRHKVRVDPENIILTIGATEGLFLACQALLNRGDEVMLFDPTYVGYPAPIRLSGGKERRILAPLSNNFEPYLEDIKQAINKKTKALLFVTPGNPTGTVLSRDFIRGVMDLADDNNFYVISDEAYKDIVYTKHHAPAAHGEKVITVGSFSKEASIPGFREGYMYGPEEIIQAALKIKGAVSLCSVKPAQVMLTRFYVDKLKEKYLSKTVVPTYRRRRDYMAKMFKRYLPDAQFNVPQGAFYIFPDMSLYLHELKMNDIEFAELLLNEKKVVVIPGTYFGKSGKNHIRFTFVSEPRRRIKEGFERISEVLQN